MTVTGPEPAGTADHEFRVTSHSGDRCSVVEVLCELDIETAPSLKQVLAQELDSGCRALVVDLSGCEFLGSKGISALLGAQLRVESTSSRMALAGPSHIARRALEVSGLERWFDIYPSAEDAVTALTQTTT